MGSDLSFLLNIQTLTPRNELHRQRALFSAGVRVLSRFIGLWRCFQLLFRLILSSVFLALICGEEVLNIGKKAFYYCLQFIIRNIPLASFHKATRLLNNLCWSFLLTYSSAYRRHRGGLFSFVRFCVHGQFSAFVCYHCPLLLSL